MKRMITVILMVATVALAADTWINREVPSALKTDELKAAENCYMWVCETAGYTNKLTFSELIGVLLPVAATNRTAFTAYKDAAMTVDSIGKRYDMKWWDTCTRHSEIPDASNALIQATIYLSK